MHECEKKITTFKNNAKWTYTVVSDWNKYSVYECMVLLYAGFMLYDTDVQLFAQQKACFC